MKKTLLAKLLFSALVLITWHSNAQVIATQTFNTSLGWASTTTTLDSGSTSAGWARVTTGTNPTCSPYAGAGMAKFKSYNIPANSYAMLTSTAMTFSGGNYRVKFAMYRDDVYDTDNDRIEFYYSTTTTVTSGTVVNGTLLGTINRSRTLAPQEAANGWYTYYFDMPSGVSGTGYIILKGISNYGNNTYLDEISVEGIPAIDGKMVSVIMDPVIPINPAKQIQGSILNQGSTTISSFDLNWQLDSGAINTQNVSGVSIAANQVYDFTHATTWNATPGQYSLKVWVSNINGAGADSDATNDQVIKSVIVVNEIFPKTVLYEEGTGTWCGWCVRGHVGLKDMDHNHPDDSWIGIAVHNADPMVLAEYDTALGGSISGYPSGLINRRSGEVDPGLAGLEVAYQAELAKTPLAKIEINNQSYDTATRALTVEVTSKFALDLANANYKLAAIVVEDNVTGTATGYNQTNYYSSNGIDITDWEGINWRTLGNPIPAASMVYRHVGRALLGGFNGQAGSIPTAVTYNTPYSYTFSYTIPATSNENNIALVGIVIDSATGVVVNAKKVELEIPSASTHNVTSTDFNLLPNPSVGIVRLSLENGKEVAVNVVDILGNIVYKANNVTAETSLDLSSLSKGVYMVNVTEGNAVTTKKLILN